MAATGPQATRRITRSDAHAGTSCLEASDSGCGDACVWESDMSQENVDREMRRRARTSEGCKRLLEEEAVAS